MRKVILQIASGREYDRGMLRGIVEYARIHGPWVFYEEPPYYLKPPPPEQRLARMRDWAADGIITPQDRAAELRELKLIKAIRYIREHANRIIQVSDVVASSGLSRRALQNRFLKEMNRTVLEAIHQARIDNIKQLLMETNLPIGAIASASGYESDAHLARFFARRTGTTRTAFRLQHHKG